MNDRDRHGRARRVDGDPRHRPPEGFRARDARRFARLVEEALFTLPAPLRAAAAGLPHVIEDVPPPPASAAPPGIPSGALEDDWPLARVVAGTLVVYRRPLELRSESRAHLTALTRSAIGQALADTTGFEWREHPEP